MTETEDPEASTELALDPFTFMPNLASRITGLGGHQSPADGAYAFHTQYVFAAPGRVHFTLRFTGLTATLGNLTVRINAIASRPGAAARTMKMVSKPLEDIARGDGSWSVAVTARPGTLYAVFASVYGPSDAVADALTVYLDRPDDGSEFTERLLAAQRTVFGVDKLSDVPRMLSAETATLADPVSQMCTAAQFDEPAFDHWMAVMQAPKSRHRKQWEFVYIMQVLQRYGMLEQGARGLGFGCGREPLPAIFANFGCTVVATDLPAGDARSEDWSVTGQHVDDREALRRPNLCPDARFDEAVSFAPVDMNAIPDTLRGFDFCWSACALEHLGSIEAGLRFITASLDCLKIGGIAVHTTELNLLSDRETVDNESTVLFRRSDFERLALNLVAHGHEVAQIKYDQGNAPIDRHIDLPPYRDDDHLKIALGNFVTTSFGIIVRKGSDE